MGPESGREGIDLKRMLFREPFRFDFFQAVRLLERFANEDPGRPSEAIGSDSIPERESARFRGTATLAFSPTAVIDVRSPPGSPYELEVSLFGLLGSSGVLPHHYSALVLHRLRDKDESLRRFTDIFLHRLLSLFYRAWEKYRLPFSYERSRREGEAGDDPVTWSIYCMAGFGTQGLRGRLEVPDTSLLFYSGHLAHSPKCAASLEGILREYFGLPLEVIQMVPRWLSLDDADRTQMGKANHSMKGGIVVGRRVRDIQGKFRLRIGPLSLAQFRRLVPGGDMLRPLWQLTRLYVGPDLDFDVQPILKKEEVPGTELTTRAPAAARGRLGYNTWGKTRQPPEDAEEAVFRLQE
jgi:type VI secretion system protein ImpH